MYIHNIDIIITNHQVVQVENTFHEEGAEYIKAVFPSAVWTLVTKIKYRSWECRL